MYQYLSKLKSMIGVTGDYHDELLDAYVDEVKEYMLSAGVPSSTLESEKAVGVIARGVEDLWVEKSLSNYFYQRVTQLSGKGGR